METQRIKGHIVSVNNKAAFLDVDGVIRHNDRSKNGGNYYNLSYEGVDWIDGAIEAHDLLYKMGYSIFWITMQNCIAEGKISHKDCDSIFRQMRDHVNGVVGKEVVNGYTICVTTEDKKDKINAKRDAVLEIAEAEGIDLFRSFGCGDARADVLAFNRAGVGGTCHIDLPDTTVKNDHNVVEADGIAPNLLSAVTWLSCRGYDPNSLFINQVTKMTGKEYWILNDKAKNKCYKILHIFRGRKSSYHCHHVKSEKFTVLRGLIKFKIGDETIFADAGDTFDIPQEACHSFESLTDMAIILEESTHHEDEDTYRETPSCASSIGGH